jgi:hypothetical protein
MASSENAIPASATATLVVVDDGPEVDPFSIQKQSKKYVLLSIFVLAQFMDVASNSMVPPLFSFLAGSFLTKKFLRVLVQLFPAVPQIAADLEMTGTQPSWIFAAYSATFAAFLLIVRTLVLFRSEYYHSNNSLALAPLLQSGRCADIYTPSNSYSN